MEKNEVIWIVKLLANLHLYGQKGFQLCICYLVIFVVSLDLRFAHGTDKYDDITWIIYLGIIP